MQTYSFAKHVESALVGTFTAIILLLPFHAFFSTWLGTNIGPLLVWKSWKEILLVILLPVVVVYLCNRPTLLRQLWGRWYNKLIVAFAGLHVVLLLVSSVGADAALAGLMTNLRFLALFLLAQLLIETKHPWVAKVKQWIPGWILWTGIVLSILAILQVYVLPKDFLVQFGYNKDTTIAPFTLLDDNQSALRAFATMRGPNTLGAFLLLPLGLSLYMFLRKQRQVLAGIAFGLSAFVLILTGSRSAWIGALIALTVILLYALPRPTVKKMFKFGTVPAVLLIGIFLWLSVTVPALRLAVFHSSPDDSHLLEGSTEKHWEATWIGLQDGLSHPLGQGSGSAGPASFYAETPKISENYYVQLLQEVGVLGLLLFLAICWLVVAALHKAAKAKDAVAVMLVASFAGISIINIFLHGWADDPLAMIWWGLAGLYMTYGLSKNPARHLQ